MIRSRFARTWMSTLIAGAALVLVAGCGSSSNSTSSSSSTPPSTTASTATTTPTETTSTSANEESSASGSTPPGKKLSLGETAKVLYEPPASTGANAPKFSLEVTVTAIEKGTLSDFNGIKLDSTEKASTPTYIKAKITNVGEGDADKEDNPAVSVEGVDSSGENIQGVVFFGEFPRCEYKEPPKPFTKGKSYETCITILVPGGVSKASYTGTEKYLETPVVWE
jgi:hypothetical protein